MINHIINLYEKLFASRIFFRLNKLLFTLSVKGLGVDNSHTVSEDATAYTLNQLSLEAGNNSIMGLDIGANNGQFAAQVINAFSAPEIYSFEPHPKTFSRLMQTVASYKNIIPVQKGCADIVGKLSIYDYEGQEGSEHASMVKMLFHLSSVQIKLNRCMNSL